MFDWLINDPVKESLRKENAELRKELAEIRRKELIKNLLTPLITNRTLGSPPGTGLGVLGL